MSNEFLIDSARKGVNMILYIIRGLPGSGKSTYAKKIGCFHVEADMYYLKDKKYDFDISKAQLAHNWCQETAWAAMENGIDVCVSNTFSQKIEIQPYSDFTAKTGHKIKIISLTEKYGSVHKVPETTIQNMIDRWEKIEGEEEI
jgi:predicted kinase